MTKKRKFIAYMVSMIVFAIIILNGAMSGAEFVTLMKAAFFIFVGGNAFEHWTDRKVLK